MTERIEFGYKRSNCACKECKTNCRYMPGFLIPADLERLLPQRIGEVAPGVPGFDLDWAEANLLASPGATVMYHGEVFRIPTLVPATKPDGSCKNLNEQGLCVIHENAPFGCAFFDCRPERGKLSHKGLMAVLDAWHAEPPSQYAFVWAYLWELGRRQHGPQVLRARMAQETGRF